MPYAGTHMHTHPSEPGVNHKLSEALIICTFAYLRHDDKTLASLASRQTSSSPFQSVIKIESLFKVLY